MENSAFEAMYMSVYVLIFVIALTASIFLFNSISAYSETAYEYGKRGIQGSVTMNTPVNRYKILEGKDLISYYYNYVAKKQETDSAGTIYNVSIEKAPIVKVNSDGTRLIPSYKEISEKIPINKQYLLTYVSEKKESGKPKQVNINIREATDKEVEETV